MDSVERYELSSLHPVFRSPSGGSGFVRDFSPDRLPCCSALPRSEFEAEKQFDLQLQVSCLQKSDVKIVQALANNPSTIDMQACLSYERRVGRTI